MEASEARCYGYIRTSTKKQVLSIDVQKANILRWAVKNQVQIASFFIDHGLSGTLLWEKRPALRALLEVLGPGDMLIAASRDRIARDPVVMAHIKARIKEYGANLVTVEMTEITDDSPIHEFYHYLLDSFREQRRARSTDKRVEELLDDLHDICRDSETRQKTLERILSACQDLL